jgi:hypothetical protein
MGRGGLGLAWLATLVAAESNLHFATNLLSLGSHLMGILRPLGLLSLIVAGSPVFAQDKSVPQLDTVDPSVSAPAPKPETPKPLALAPAQKPDNQAKSTKDTIAAWLKTCLADWDRATHMTKGEWTATCRRVSAERGKFLTEDAARGYPLVAGDKAARR